MILTTALSLSILVSANPLDGVVQALRSASQLQVELSINELSGGSRSVSVTLGKPNHARIEAPNQLVVAEGSRIVTLDKSDNTYFVTPQTPEALLGLLDAPELTVFRAFFDEQGLAGARNAQAAGSRTRQGVTLRAVKFTSGTQDRIETTLYVDDQHLPRQAEITLRDPSGTSTLIVNMREVGVSDRVDAGLFAFTPPAGARELDKAELVAGKWFTDLEEAKKVAAATGRLILLDFYTDWCTFCKRLDAEVFQNPRFKQDAAKDFVLVKINAERQPAVARAYGVNAYPTIFFTKADGTAVHTVRGYVPLDRFLAEMSKARGATP